MMFASWANSSETIEDTVCREVHCFHLSGGTQGLYSFFTVPLEFVGPHILRWEWEQHNNLPALLL